MLLWLASLHRSLVAQIFSLPFKERVFTPSARPLINLPALGRQITAGVVVVPLLLLLEGLLWEQQQVLRLAGI